MGFPGTFPPWIFVAGWLKPWKSILTILAEWFFCKDYCFLYGFLGGGFKYVLFSPLPGEDFQFD